MLKNIIFLVAICVSVVAHAQYYPISGFCVKGADPAKVSGLPSTNYLQGVIPNCTVTVYLTGTTNKATLYSNATGTPRTNPFTASFTSGQWIFYVTNGQQYDIVMSGGNPPNIYSLPVTITAASPSSGGGGNPSPPAYSVQAASSPSATVLTSDPNITVNPATHTLQTYVRNEQVTTSRHYAFRFRFWLF